MIILKKKSYNKTFDTFYSTLDEMPHSTHHRSPQRTNAQAILLLLCNGIVALGLALRPRESPVVTPDLTDSSFGIDNGASVIPRQVSVASTTSTVRSTARALVATSTAIASASASASAAVAVAVAVAAP